LSFETKLCVSAEVLEADARDLIDIYGVLIFEKIGTLVQDLAEIGTLVQDLAKIGILVQDLAEIGTLVQDLVEIGTLVQDLNVDNICVYAYF
jgi:hypothetical protein